MLDLNVQAIDMDKASDGVWFVFNDNISFKVARVRNPGHERALQAKDKQIQKLEERGGESKKLERLRVEIMARYILKDWKGLKDGEKNLPYSESSAIEILLNPKYESIKLFILESATDYAEFEDGAEETIKN